MWCTTASEKTLSTPPWRPCASGACWSSSAQRPARSRRSTRSGSTPAARFTSRGPPWATTCATPGNAAGAPTKSLPPPPTAASRSGSAHAILSARRPVPTRTLNSAAPPAKSSSSPKLHGPQAVRQHHPFISCRDNAPVTEQRLTPSEAPDAGAVQSLPAPRPTVHEPQLPGALSAPPERTLIDIVRDTAARYPDASALDDGHRSLSYAQLMDEVRATARKLHLAGLGAGDKIGVR